MNKRILFLAAITLAMSSCAAPISEPAPTVTVTATETMTAPPPEVVPPATPAKAGTKFTVNEAGATATFFKYKQIRDQWNKDIGAFEVEVCLGTDMKDGSTPGVSSQRWNLRDSNSGTYNQSSGYTGTPVSPMYPDDVVMNWGECARGWIIMPVKDGTTITEARYVNQDNEIFAWKI